MSAASSHRPARRRPLPRPARHRPVLAPPRCSQLGFGSWCVPRPPRYQRGLVAAGRRVPDQQRVAAARYSSRWKSRFARLRSAWSGRRRRERGPARAGRQSAAAAAARASGLGLEQQPHVVEWRGRLAVDDPHGRAAVRVHRDQARAGQGLERLAHRGLGDAERPAASSVSTRACPGLSSPARIACLIARARRPSGTEARPPRRSGRPARARRRCRGRLRDPMYQHLADTDRVTASRDRA